MPKVEVDSIVERHLISRMRDGAAALQAAIDEWVVSGTVPETDWGRMRALDFQELLRSRDAVMKRLGNRSCKSCPNFEEHVGVDHLERNVTAHIYLVCSHARRKGSPSKHCES